MIKISDCNGCGDQCVEVRFLKLSSDEWGWNYCRKCWPKLAEAYQEDNDEPLPDFDDE